MNALLVNVQFLTDHLKNLKIIIMRRIISLFILFIYVTGFVACSSRNTQNKDKQETHKHHDHDDHDHEGHDHDHEGHDHGDHDHDHSH